MLDARYKKPANALKLYSVCLIVGLTGATLTVATFMAGIVSEALALTLAAGALLFDGIGILGFAVGTFAIAVYAKVPKESGAQASAKIAAVSAFIQLAVSFSSLGQLFGMPESYVQLVALVELLFAMITLLAMSRSLSKLGLYIRADEVFSRASMLFTGLVLLVVLWMGTIGVIGALAWGESALHGSATQLIVASWAEGAMAGLVVTLAFSLVGSVLIAFAYTALVFKAGRALDELIYE